MVASLARCPSSSAPRLSSTRRRFPSSASAAGPVGAVAAGPPRGRELGSLLGPEGLAEAGSSPLLHFLVQLPLQAGHLGTGQELRRAAGPMAELRDRKGWEAPVHGSRGGRCARRETPADRQTHQRPEGACRVPPLIRVTHPWGLRNRGDHHPQWVDLLPLSREHTQNDEEIMLLGL